MNEGGKGKLREEGNGGTVYESGGGEKWKQCL